MTTLREPGTFQHEAGAKICIPAVEARGQEASRSAALCREGKEPKHSSEKLANGRTERLAELLHAALQKPWALSMLLKESVLSAKLETGKIRDVKRKIC